MSILTLNRTEADLSDQKRFRAAVSKEPFDVAVNCAALTDVDYCESHREEADRVNGHAVADIAWVPNQFGARVIHISTDYVFDGKASRPYVETDRVNPISVYGASKLLGEEMLFKEGGEHVVIRTSWLFGVEKPAFLEWVLKQAQMKTVQSTLLAISGPV